jgi:hypothetical protein
MNVTVPTGANTATVQVLDANGADITGSCTLQVASSDSTIIQIGSPDAASPNVIPFTALGEGGSADVSYTATNAEGQVVQTDTLTVAVTAPASMVITYGTTVPVPAPSKSKK